MTAAIDPLSAPTVTAAMRAGLAQWPEIEVTFTGARGEPTQSLAALFARGRRLAGGLYAHGLRAGDAIAMQLPNWPEAVVTFVAAAELGLTLVPVVHIYGQSELKFVLRQSGAVALVIPDQWRGISFPDRIQPADRPDTLRHVIVLGDDVPEGFVSWQSVMDSAGEYPVSNPSPDDRTLLLYTSGTTGEPKGVVHTHRTLIAEIAQVLRYMDSEEGDVALVSFPIGHMAGVLGCIRLFVRNRHSIFLDVWDAALAARLVDEYGVTSTAGTPFHLISLFEAADAAGLSLASFRSFMLGATTVAPSLIEQADARGIRAYRCYGSTEQPTISSGRPSDSFQDRAFTDGHLLPGVEVRILDDDDHDLPFGSAGEIVTRGPDLTPGYTNPEHDAATRLPGGWFRTGDIGVLDERGFLTITDRKKDIIIRGGENIASREVEDVLVTHAGVREVAVIGLPDERYGERVCAVVVAAGEGLSLDDVRAHVAAAGLARQKTPESLVIVDEMPRTASGKIQKAVLRDRLKG
ncbi:MAG: AMP-binding protein [Actinomycetota bacterium]|nr:AMP-binding protein [Actinomycetota bacterium]